MDTEKLRALLTEGSMVEQLAACQTHLEKMKADIENVGLSRKLLLRLIQVLVINQNLMLQFATKLKDVQSGQVEDDGSVGLYVDLARQQQELALFAAPKRIKFRKRRENGQ